MCLWQRQTRGRLNKKKLFYQRLNPHKKYSFFIMEIAIPGKTGFILS